MAFRPRLSASLALSAKAEHTLGVVGYQGSQTLNLRESRTSAFGQQTFESTLWRSTTPLYPFRDPVSPSPMRLPLAPGTAWAMSLEDCGKYCRP